MASDPVLLLHGQPGRAHDWEQVRAAIGRRTPTLAIDRPGWDRGTLPTDLEGNVQAALAALDANRVPRATVVGHSLGAAVAALLAAAHPERVGALVLVAPAANTASLDRLDQLLATRTAGRLATAALLALVGLGLVVGPARRRISRRFGLDDRYLRHALPLLLSPASWRAFWMEQRTLVRELPSLEAQLETITAPTIIAAGTADRVVSPQAARRLAAQIPAAELVLIEGAGHLLPQRHPAEIAALIARVGERTTRPRSSTTS